jgi:hypothetical protein
MRQALVRFWQDEAGLATADWAFIATILLLGAITGAVASQWQALPEQEAPPAVRR